MTADPSLRPFVLLGCLLGGASSAAAQDVVVGVDVPAASRVPLGRVDHSAWDALLNRRVDGEGRVDYRGWKASADDTAALDAYLATLSAGDRAAPATAAERIAFWSNAYNALTVKGILREYPIKSIRERTPKLWGYHIWKNLKLRVGGTPINLNDIEHEVLRKLGDCRIHFAIVCASMGCPRLLDEAYTPERLDRQLDRNARHFFAQPRNFRVEGGTAHASAIFRWFADDFGGDDPSVLRTIAPYVEDPATREAIARGELRLKHLEYDWSLNEQE